MSKTQTHIEIIDDIKHRLDGLEELMFCLVKAEHRFKVGQRVKFSKIADRRGITHRIKGGVRKGTVVALNHFSMKVNLDGYRVARGFHHMFFDPMRPTP